MTEQAWAGWMEAHELPASGHLRTVAEILSAPPSAEERRARRREDGAAEAKRAGVRDAADVAATAAFRARVNGTPPRDVLGEAAAEPLRDREALTRRRAAIEALRPLGLADVITGGASGCVMDPHLGILEPETDLAQRAEMDREYEFGRSERAAEQGRRDVDRARAQNAERWRARILGQPAQAQRSEDVPRHVSFRGGSW